MYGRVLSRSFYARGAVTVARDLLGRVMVSEAGGEFVAGRIVEVEAYRAGSDPASHAFRGSTMRNRVMFGPPGHAYVYFTYGMHHCVNLVCEREGSAAAVLVRALEPLEGLSVLRRRRGRDDLRTALRGPGCVAQGLGLSREHDGVDLAGGLLRVLAGSPRRAGERIVRGPRIGIRQGLEQDWRFWYAGNPHVSGSRQLPEAERAGRLPR